MRSRLRSPALALACGALMLSGGCGFQPLYATPGFADLPGLQIETGSSRQEYLVEQALDRFLGGGRSPFRLTLSVGTGESRLGVSAAGNASRYAYIVSARYVLRGLEDGRLTGSVSETVYFDAPSDPYALIAARSDAEERAATRVANSLARDIAVQLERRRSAQPS